MNTRTNTTTVTAILSAAILFLAAAPSHADEVKFLSHPCRLMDTRNTGSRMTANTEMDFRVRGTTGYLGGETGCSIPIYATGVLMSVVAVSPASNGYARVWQWNTTSPLAVSLLITGGQNTNVMSATVALADFNFPAEVALYSTVASDYVIDIYGYTTDCLMAPEYLAALPSCSSGCMQVSTIPSVAEGGDSARQITACYERLKNHQQAQSCGTQSLCV